jgi:hypothetical protein
MTYFADLTPYGYRWVEPRFNERVLNVGWLDSSASFDRGPVKNDLFEKLFRLCQKPVNGTRGFHRCPFRPSDSSASSCPYPAEMKLGPWAIVVGNAEIRVPGNDGIVYAAPTLIGHFIQTHGYRPPEEFLAAVARL